MSFDFATAKAQARRAVSSAFGVTAFYSDDSIITPIETRARWHDKTSRPVGDLDNGGYSEIVEGIDRIVLIPEDVDGDPFVIQRNGIMTFESIPDVEFQFDHRIPADGPLEEVWVVTRK